MESKEIFEIDTIITNVLSELGVPSHVYGYRFLTMAVKLAVEDADAVSKVTKNIFTPIVKKFNITPQRVSTEISRAIQIAFDRGLLATLLEDNKLDPKVKPKSQEFITIVSKEIRSKTHRKMTLLEFT